MCDLKVGGGLGGNAECRGEGFGGGGERMELGGEKEGLLCVY